jgi:hypothetical protein
MNYQLGPSGQQYVVIAAGGHARMRSKLDDYRQSGSWTARQVTSPENNLTVR